MTTPQQAISLRRDLRRQINRARILAARCTQQACDADLPDVDRASAESRANLAMETAFSLEDQLERVEEALTQ